MWGVARQQVLAISWLVSARVLELLPCLVVVTQWWRSGLTGSASMQPMPESQWAAHAQAHLVHVL